MRPHLKHTVVSWAEFQQLAWRPSGHYFVQRNDARLDHYEGWRAWVKRVQYRVRYRWFLWRSR